MNRQKKENHNAKGCLDPSKLPSHRMIPTTYFPGKKQVMYHSSLSFILPDSFMLKHKNFKTIIAFVD